MEFVEILLSPAEKAGDILDHTRAGKKGLCEAEEFAHELVARIPTAIVLGQAGKSLAGWASGKEVQHPGLVEANIARNVKSGDLSDVAPVETNTMVVGFVAVCRIGTLLDRCQDPESCGTQAAGQPPTTGEQVDGG